MQTEVALSKTEAEYVALSQRTRYLNPNKNLVEYLNTFNKVSNKEINTYSTLFGDNLSTLQLETEPKYSPKTKRLCFKYHHFRQYVKKKVISIRAIGTDGQQVDVLTKLLALYKCRKFIQLIMG